MRLRSVVGLGVLALVVTTARASAQSVGNMVVSDVRNAVGDVVGVWIAPLHSNARDWLGAVGVVGLSAAVSPWDDDVDRWMVSHHDASAWSALKAFREGGVAFAGKTITPVVVGVYTVGLVTKSQPIRDAVWGCVASYGSESLVRSQVIYRLFARNRPDSVRGAHTLVPSEQGDQYHFGFPGDGWGKHSMPAGHVANIAACASYLTHRFHTGWATPAVYSVVAGVGVGRMVDRRHWTSDTVLGTLFGYAIGKEVATRTLHREAHPSSPEGAITHGAMQGLLFSPGERGMLVGWQMSF